MDATLTRLYPDHTPGIPVRGVYLAHRLHELGHPGQPFIYANFVESLDGRIAMRDASTGVAHMPAELASPTDLRLLLELHAQADCLVTNSGYLRAIAEGRLDDILQVGTVRGHEDLADWRQANDLSRQPAVCIASASLDFPFPASMRSHGQHVFVVTGKNASAKRIASLRADGYDVLFAGEERDADGAGLVQALARRGMRSAFLLAGPRLLEATLRDGVLSRFYLTITHELVGGEHFHSLIEGRRTAGAGQLRLSALYLDTSRPNGPDQFFAQFAPRSPSSDHSHSSSA